jgi:hypothetical protein
MSLDQTNVPGDAIVLSCDTSVPGTLSFIERLDGAIATSASRKELQPGSKHNGLDSRTRPRMAEGCVAAKIAANVPPNE